MKPEGRLDSVIRREILQCLREKQQVRAAARVLGIGRQTLYNKVKALGIEPRDWRGVSADCVAASTPFEGPPDGLLKELADLVARYSLRDSLPPDPVVRGEFFVPANGFPAPRRERKSQVSAVPSPERGRGLGLVVHAGAESRAPIVGNESMIDLFLRLGIDLRRKNISKRRHGFWRRFEGRA